MKRKFLCAIFFLLLAATVFAQTEEARKLDEFGTIPCDEYLARADGMIVEQGNNPGATIYVLIYDGKETRPVFKNGQFIENKLVSPTFGSAKARIESMKMYLKRRKIAVENYVFVNGGFREKHIVEIWLVPPGAEPPKPTPTLEKMKYRKGKAARFCLACCG